MKIIHSGPSVGFFDQRYLKLDCSNDPLTGNLLLTPTVDSTSVLQVQQADTTVVLNVDTTNARVGINTVSPDTSLQVVGNTKLGDDNTNYTEFEADGTLKMVGDATVFEDLQFPISNAKVPAANAPTWETFTTNTNEYGFAVDDFIDTQANELPHSWKQGGTGHIHMHITTKAANDTGSARFAKFTVLVAYCDTGETWQESSFTAELTIPDGTLALEQFYLDLGNLTLTNYVIEAQVRCRVTRIDATGGTEYSGNIFITQVGIHLENDTIGSRAENTK